MKSKLLSLVLLLISSATAYASPQWANRESIYEVNVRQFSRDGSLRAVENALPYIKQLGAKAIWLMPIHPIGIENRKGTLGSPYSIRDYLDVNPEFGTKADFRSLVAKAHDLGMYVIMDWVANHTSWDHVWTRFRPDFYNQDASGGFYPPVPDWHDVIDLNFGNPNLVEEMIRSMEYWVREFNIDGFRCDVASLVPYEFWSRARQRLNRIKPVFMLAESEDRELFRHGFDAIYGSHLYRTFIETSMGRKNAEDVWRAFEAQRGATRGGGLYLQFTSNHDENTWNGDLYERLGDASGVFSVLSVTLPGIPLIYGGQEAGLAKRLAFFEKDPIIWRNHWFADMYARLFALKNHSAALQSGIRGGALRRLQTGQNGEILAFVRQSGNDTVIVMTNLSPRTKSFRLSDLGFKASLRDVLVDQTVEVSPEMIFNLVPWGFRVFSTR